MAEEGHVKIVITAEDKATAQIGQITKTTGSMLNLMAGQAIANLGQMGKALSDDMVNNFASFDSAMKNSISIMSGGVEAESKLTEMAQKMGVQYGQSSKMIAEGYYQLASSGYNANQILALTPSVMQLSTATATDFTDTINVLTGAMEQYHYSADDASKISAILMNTVVGTKTTLSELGLTMQYAGQAAASAGVSLQDTAAAIMILRKNGLEASQTGTALRRIMLSMIDPSVQQKMAQLGIQIKKTSSGGLDFTGTLKEIKKYLDSTGDATEDTGVLMDLFGQRSAGAASALIDNIDALDKYSSSLGDTAPLQKALNIQLDSTKTKLDRANERMEQAQRELGEAFAPATIAASNAMAGLVGITAQLPEPLLKVGGGIFVIASQSASALGPVMQMAASLSLLRGQGLLTRVSLINLGLATAAAMGIFGLATAQTDKERAMFAAMIGITAGLTAAKWALTVAEMSYIGAATMGVGVAAAVAGISYGVAKAMEAQKQSTDATTESIQQAAQYTQMFSSSSNDAATNINSDFSAISDSAKTTTEGIKNDFKTSMDAANIKVDAGSEEMINSIGGAYDKISQMSYPAGQQAGSDFASGLQNGVASAGPITVSYQASIPAAQAVASTGTLTESQHAELVSALKGSYKRLTLTYPNLTLSKKQLTSSNILNDYEAYAAYQSAKQIMDWWNNNAYNYTLGNWTYDELKTNFEKAYKKLLPQHFFQGSYETFWAGTSTKKSEIPQLAISSYFTDDFLKMVGQYLGKDERYKLATLATGGIITAPTLSLIGEAGPEAVIPLERAGLGGGNTFYITINAGSYEGGVAAADGLTDELMRRGVM